MTGIGNHDITLDEDFYTEHGPSFHNQHLEDSQACIDLVQQYPSLTFLNHETTAIRLSKPGGPGTSFVAFGSPYSPRHGLWAFGYPPEAAESLWDSIPMHADIVITHTPPKYHCDESGSRAAIGCEGLRKALWRVRPSLSVCGHVHEGRGAQRVLWDLDSPNVKYKELATGYWEDPGNDNKKQSLLDLTPKGGAVLQNTGSLDKSIALLPDAAVESRTLSGKTSSAVRGQGGDALSGRSDREALAGRTGRKETCIVNAAIMASSWPYKAKLGRKYNKPMVVDLDLPVWTAEAEEALDKADP